MAHQHASEMISSQTSESKAHHCGGGHHHHNHGPIQDYSRIFMMTIALNTLFVIVEFTYGFLAQSTALMADAGHNLSDVLGLLLAWGASVLCRKQPGGRYTYGLRSTTMLAALLNAMLLLVACGGIALEAIQRFFEPPVVSSMTVSIVATVGILINGWSAWLFLRGRKTDLNIRGAYWHMVADAAVSLGVALTGLIMLYTQWYWLDPVISLVIMVVVLIGTWGLFRDSIQLVLSAVPAQIDVNAVGTYLHQLKGVEAIHDLHIWAMSTTENALTVHLVMPGGYPGDDFMDEITETLKQRFSIHHSTLQIEQGTTSHHCSLIV